ncbi:MAG: NAD(P)/FAD-dependent oxidoreductase [Candidatus Omnitrophica bacterium]|nr:NAD(P)/FAD-dependent oxidoreductase [Candidatus Omnitrophota bacterium]
MARVYDIAVIGAGAAGCMAAISAGRFRKKIILIERNNAPARKLLLTGKGRCNLTNAADIDAFIEAFGKQGNFLRSAFSAFSNHGLMSFFNDRGLELKTERQGRVFPASDRSSSVVDVLKKCLKERGIEILYDSRLSGIIRKNGGFELEIMNKAGKIYAEKVILATGGASFSATGSSGDGFRIAQKSGHTIAALKPALVPLKTKEKWVKQLQGLPLKNVRAIFKYGNKKISSGVGEVMFTHFGVSGPLVLDLSGRVVCALQEYKEAMLYIDLKPGLSPEQIEGRLLREFGLNKNSQIKNVMKNLLPHSLIPVFLGIGGIQPEKKANQVNRNERRAIADLLKAFPLTVNGSLPVEEAMVTNGGIPVKEINPRTMESRIVPGLYFAGEIIDGCAYSGGYNLQQAFSTGFLAGESAAYA